MSKLLRFVIFFAILAIYCQSGAYITDVLRWKRDGQTVIGCGDVHDYAQMEANWDQRMFLGEHFESLARNSTYVLVEDIKEYEGSDAAVREYTEARRVWMPQSGRVASARSIGLAATNIAYNPVRAAALCPFISGGKKDTPIMARDVVQEFDTVVESVRAYNDCPRLTKFYENHITEINEKNSSILAEIRQYPGPLTHWIRSRIPVEKQLSYAMRLSAWDVRLLELKAIHEVFRNPNKQKIIIFAGAMHIFNIGNVLHDLLGYQKASPIGIDYEFHDSRFSSSLEPDTVIGNDAGIAARSQAALNHFTPLPAEDLKVIFE